MKFFKNKKGFTLVELVVVVAILGILAGIAIPRFMDATAAARGSKIVADLRTIDSSIMMYYATNGTSTTPDLDTDLKGTYLADTPKPSTGSAITTNNSNGKVAWNVKTATYTIITTQKASDGTTVSLKTARAAIGTRTVDDILGATASTTEVDL